MTGLARKGNGIRNAINSAKIFNQLNPYFLSIDSLTLFPDTKLFSMAQNNKFTPAGEYERIQETPPEKTSRPSGISLTVFQKRYYHYHKTRTLTQLRKLLGKEYGVDERKNDGK